MDGPAYLASFDADSTTIADVAAANLEKSVPACPGWDVGDLIGHLGGAYVWATMVTEAAGARPQGHRDRPPEARSELMEWFSEKRRAVLSALVEADPRQAAWTAFSDSARDVAWWKRREALETAVHLADVQQAVGIRPTIDAELAADGIEELLTEFVPPLVARHPVDGLEGTLHVHFTDTDIGTGGEWLLAFSGGSVDVRREHAKGDAALRGPAAELYLWLWNRVSLDDAGIEVFGDRRLVEAWGQIKL